MCGFNTHYEDRENILKEARAVIPTEKLPPGALTLVTYCGQEVDEDFKLSTHCVNQRIRQLSRVKSENKVFIVSQEHLKRTYIELITFIFFVLHSTHFHFPASMLH